MGGESASGTVAAPDPCHQSGMELCLHLRRAAPFTLQHLLRFAADGSFADGRHLTRRLKAAGAARGLALRGHWHLNPLF